MDSTDNTPPTTSDIPLAGNSTPAWTPSVSSLPRFGSTPAGRQPGQTTTVTVGHKTLEATLLGLHRAVPKSILVMHSHK